MAILESLYLILGKVVFLPIPRGEKGPRIYGWQKKTLADMENPTYLNSFIEGGNIGVLLGQPSNGLCVIDIDSDEWVMPFLALNPALAVTLRTRGSRGCSLWLWISGYYPKAGKIKDTKGNAVMEWRADSQQSVIYGLHPNGMTYQRIIEASPVTVAFGEIVWPDGLQSPWKYSTQTGFDVQKSEAKPSPDRSIGHTAPSIIENARKYIAKIPPAISGQSGHDQSFAVACALIKGFNLSISDAWPLFKEYNSRCQPCWSDRELEHKLIEADQEPDSTERGYLILSESNHSGRVSSKDLPTIRLPGQAVTISQSARHLFEIIAPSHTLFIRGGRVMEKISDLDGRHRLQIVSPSAFRSRAEKFAFLVAWRSGRGNEPVLKPIPMPEETAKALLDTKEARELLPHVKAIINCSLIVADDNGHRIVGNGYDESGLLVNGITPPVIALDKAAAAIKELVEEFDFASPADRSRALASILTPALKLGGHIRGFVPADVAEADQSQAGKTYRQRIVAAIYNEVLAIIVKREGGVGSLDESLAQKLLSGAPFIQFDNVRGKTDSQYLESLLTADKTFSVRIPHHGEVEINPEYFFIFLSSNGVEATRDLANRSSIIRIRKRVDYTYKSYPDGDLLNHVRTHSSYYLGCIFAIVGEWLKEGKPRTKETRHDFRDWVQVLDWIVQKVLKEAPLMDGHAQAQERTSNPATTLLRKLAISLEEAGKLDVELCASDIYEHCEEQALEIPGLTQANPEAGRKRIGVILGKIFQSTDGEVKLSLDGFWVERKIRRKYDANRQEFRDQKVYVFTRYETMFHQPELPQNPANPIH